MKNTVITSDFTLVMKQRKKLTDVINWHSRARSKTRATRAIPKQVKTWLFISKWQHGSERSYFQRLFVAAVC